MPGNRKNAKKSTARKAPARRRYRRRRTPLYRSVLPNHMNYRLHYTRTVQMKTPGPLSGSDHIIFYPNSILDCVGQSGVQQPYLRDQLYTLYQQSRVLKWSIFIKAISLSTSLPMEVVLSPARDNVYDSDIDLAKSRKYAKSCLALAGQTKYLKLGMYVDQYFGLPKGTVLKHPDHIQTNGTDLSTQHKTPVQLLVFDTSQTLAVNTPIVAIQYHVNMWVRFENQLDQSAS